MAKEGKKKKTVKKTPAKKAKKAPAISKEYYFFVANGIELKDIRELAKHMDEMTEDVFRHHVNDVKNDFANWVEHVLKEKKLANEIRHITDKDKMHIRLLSHMLDDFLEKRGD